MKLKTILTFLFITLLLTSCGRSNPEEIQVIEKQDFIVETSKLSSFSGTYEIEKTGKIQPGQDIILSSKVTGRVGSISVNFGDSVYVGQNLLNLVDNVANYGINLERSILSVESAVLSYDQNKISLDKQVNDSEIALSRQEKDHEILEKKLKEDIRLAKINLDNSLSGQNTSSGFISKAELDYNNLVNSNLERIKSFELSSKNDYLSLRNIFVDVIDFSDGVLGVTDLNDERNDDFEDYLGIRNSTLLGKTESELLNVISYKKQKFDSVNLDTLSIDNIDILFQIGDEGYPKLINFLDNLEKVLDNSIENIHFTRSEIDGYKSQINGYQAELQGKYNGFLSFKSSVREFLNTYKDNEEILKRSLEISSDSASISYNKLILDAENALNTSYLSLKTAQLNLENAKKTRDVTLKQLENSIKLAKNSKSLASKEYSKLFVSSPINGVVSDVLVDEGQDLSIGTPILNLSSVSQDEIEIGLNFSELSLVNPGDEVRIDYLGNTLTGYINSISKIADENLNYKTKISVNSNINISGNIVKVFIPVNLDKKLISLESLKVNNDNFGEINVLTNGENQTLEISKVIVKFGDFYGENVEFIGCVELDETQCNNLEIITNDVSNFDKNKFNIKIK